jgi:hypothetical protein
LTIDMDTGEDERRAQPGTDVHATSQSTHETSARQARDKRATSDAQHGARGRVESKKEEDRSCMKNGR